MNAELKIGTTFVKLISAIPSVWLFGCAPTAPAALTSLCDIRRAAAQFDQQPVVFHAEIDGDGERTIAIDRHCPELGIALKYSKTALQNGDAERIGSAIRDKLFTTNVHSISATIHGTVVAARRPDEAATVVIDRLEDFKISRPKGHP